MKPWTQQDLERIAPRPGRRKLDSDEAHADRVADHAAYIKALVAGWPEMERAQINTPLRVCHFLSQWAHETGGFTILCENMNYSIDNFCANFGNRYKKTDPIFLAKFAACRGDPEALAELAYGHKVRSDLGNSEDGDGWHYRGRGFNQITGRWNYRNTGHAIGIDLEGDPEQAEDASVSLKCAIHEWSKHKLNGFADQNFGRAIGNAINRGNPHSSKEPLGYTERQRWFDRAWAVLGNGALPVPKVDLGASGPEVEATQRRLHELGYPCGACDGQFGNETGRALASFKRDWVTATGLPLEPGDAIGPATKAALANAEPISRPEREALTVADLKAAGSTEVAAGTSMQRNGAMLGIGGMMALAEQTETTPAVVKAVDQHVGWIPGFKQTMIPVLEAMAWGFKNLLPILLILAAILFWTRGRTWIAKRVEAARRGLNLSR